MSTTVGYPGVYVEENASVLLSVPARSTAVPIIPLNAIPGGEVPGKINSFMDFVATYGEWRDENDFNVARAYFECGGGPCYLVNHQHLDQVVNYDDITLVVDAGAQIGTVIDNYCQPGSGRFGILDGPQGDISDGSGTAKLASTPHAAAYYPWLSVSWSQAHISPSLVMAALYCSADRARGVWSAPANIPLPLNYTPLYKITDAIQAQYTSGKALNMIRKVDSRGVVVWGARTLEDSDNWRYIQVRRLFDSVERDIKNAMRSLVFESNSPPTWEKMRTAAVNYLHDLWKKGALAGNVEKEAYFFQIGKGVTMTDDDIAQGRLIAKIGMAAVRPAEFLVLQFTQDIGAS